jgi:hypothetical protein
VQNLGLVGNEAIEWNNYMLFLRTSHVKIKDEEDKLVW